MVMMVIARAGILLSCCNALEYYCSVPKTDWKIIMVLAGAGYYVGTGTCWKTMVVVPVYAEVTIMVLVRHGVLWCYWQGLEFYDGAGKRWNSMVVFMAALTTSKVLARDGKLFRLWHALNNYDCSDPRCNALVVMVPCTYLLLSCWYALKRYRDAFGTYLNIRCLRRALEFYGATQWNTMTYKW